MKHLNYLKQLILPMLLLLATAIPAMAAPLNGSYTIGGASPSYATLNAAITDLNAQGVAGPVVFNIRAGSYSGTTAYGAISNVTGASATNTITFKAESGPGTVTLSPTGSSENTNGVFIFNGAKYVTIQDLTLSNLGTTYGADVQYLGNASYNIVQNCVLTGNTAYTTTAYQKSRIYAYSSNQNFNGVGNKVLNCQIPAGCSYGATVWAQGSGAGQRAVDFEISGCNIVPTCGPIYGYYVDDLKFNNNTVTRNTAAAAVYYNFYAYECDSNMQIIGNNMTAVNAGTTMYGFYRWYCDGSQAKRQTIANNIMNFTNNSTLYWKYDYYNQWDSVVGNNITATGTTATYGYNYYANYFTFNNNTINISSSASTIYVMYNYGYGYGLNHVIKNNSITGFSSAAGSPQYINYYLTNSEVSGNTISLTSTTSGTAIQYFLYCTNSKYFNNVVNNASGTSTCYGLYAAANSPNVGNNQVYNNKITAKSNGGVIYGLVYMYGNQDKVYNNAISALGTTNSTVYPMGIMYCYGPTSVYNNTVNDYTTSTSSAHYTLYTYCYSGYGGVATFTNNIFSRLSANGGACVSLYEPTPGQYTQFNYNNYYTPSTTQFAYNGWFGSVFAATFPIWRSTMGDKNSLSYPVAFTNPSIGDVTPDASNPNCWAMNGRGIHIAGNSFDVNGNPRHVITSTGVPDLGAYEFTPNTGVQPPLATVTPATPVAGGTQTYTFGFDTVATITWDAAATVPATAPTCQQYSGAAPVGMSSFNPTNMYFYTDILSSTNAAYVANVYYKDPWIGTIATEQALHLAKKDGSNPWVGYALPGSAANTVSNYIYSPSSPKLNNYGSYTGIDVPNNAGVVAIVEPAGAFCPGTYTVKVKIRNGGNNIINNVGVTWKLDANAPITINYTTPIPVNNGTPGINEAVITLGPVAFGVAPRTFKIWTSLPNGQPDPIVADDTLGPLQMRAALAGDYYVGGTSPDFPDLVTAVTALKTAGMCGPVNFKLRAGTYTGNVDLTAVTGSSATNRLTIMADNAVPAANINVTYATTSAADNYTIRFNGLSYVTIKNITITNTNAVTTQGAVYFVGTTNNDSIIGCTIAGPTNVLTTSYCGIYCNGATPNNLKLYNNTISGSCGMMMYTSTTNTPGFECIGNTINGYYMPVYEIYNFNGPKVNYNTITSTYSTGYYGMYYLYMYSNTLPCEIIGNKVFNAIYAMYYVYYPGYSATARSYITNNVVTYNNTSTCYAGLLCYYPNRVTIAHNTFAIGGASYTGGYAGFIYQYTYTADSIYNNVFANYAGGYAMYSYMYPGYQHSSDYNNFYTSGSTLIYDAYAGSYANLTSWRTSSVATSALNADKNSISYEPGIDRNTGIPDLTKPNNWSIHGRGKQNSIVTTDITGAPRPTTLAVGVPDLGAYEFEPSIAPPNAVGLPSIAAPGVTQNFTFGETPVATVAWNTQLAITTPLNVRQYSGVVAPYNFTTVSQNKYPYFYTDISPTGLGSTFDFNLTVNYYKTWLGKIPNEANMKMAHKFSSVPFWVSYNAANSSSNTANSNIYAAGVTGFGLFTGIDDGINFSATIKVVGSTVMCTGRDVTLNANPVSGGSSTYTYQWKRNGVDIVGATAATYKATAGGDYTVVITATSVFPNITAEAIPVSVIVVSPPMALITASGPLTYCLGSGLTLNASAGGTKYQWQLNGTNLGTSTTQPVTGAGTYRVIVSNVGCADTSDNTIINAGPIVVDLGKDVAGCEIKGVPYVLDAGYPGAKYVWSTGDTTQTIKVFKGAGSYSVTVDAGPNCKGTDAVAVSLDPLPSISGISYLRTGNTYVFSASGPKNVNGYLWLFSDGSSSTYPSVTKTFDGSMTAKLIVKNDCGNDTINMVNWATGINNTVNEALDASVYPNPAKDVVNFTVTGAIMKDVSIINALGEVVYRAEVGGSAKEITINVSSFAAGRYIIRSSTNEGIISKPFNVQR